MYSPSANSWCSQIPPCAAGAWPRLLVHHLQVCSRTCLIERESSSGWSSSPGACLQRGPAWPQLYSARQAPLQGDTCPCGPFSFEVQPAPQNTASVCTTCAFWAGESSFSVTSSAQYWHLHYIDSGNIIVCFC